MIKIGPKIITMTSYVDNVNNFSVKLKHAFPHNSWSAYCLSKVDPSLERYWIALYEYQWTVASFKQFFLMKSS